MSNILRNIVRSGAVKSVALQQSVGIRSIGARSLWHMSKPADTTSVHRCTGFGCPCRSGLRFASSLSAGEKSLVDFLHEEIAAEKQDAASHLPSQLDGFQVKLDAAEVELTKQSPNEKVVIKFNVNHTVDAEGQNDLELDNQQQSQQEPPKMKSKPAFEVDIVKKDTTLSLSCTFLAGEAAEGEYEDIFGIEEVTIFKGDHSEKVYAVAGDILDGYFYDLLMNLLAEKGVTDEFVHKVSELATQHEHTLYINLMEETKKFFESK